MSKVLSHVDGGWVSVHENAGINANRDPRPPYEVSTTANHGLDGKSRLSPRPCTPLSGKR